MSGDERVPVDEAELRELFRPRRVAPEAFRAAVARRIAEREAARARAADAARPAESVLRRAAGWLASDPGTAGGPLKLLGGALFLPLMLLALQVAAFAGGLRAVRHATDGSTPPRSSAGRRRLGKTLLGSLQACGVLVLLAPMLLRAQWAIDLLTLLFLAASAALALSVRTLAEDGALTPRAVARLTTTLLGGLFAGFFLWRTAFRVADGGSELGLGWSAAVVLLGTVLCPLAVRGGPRRAGTRLLALGNLVFALGLVLGVNTLGLTRSSPDELVRQLAALGTRLDPAELRGWREAAALHDALVAVGVEPPRVARAEERLARALAGDDAPHPVVLTSALRLGILPRAGLERLVTFRLERYSQEQLLASDAPLLGPSYEEYRVHALLATRVLSEAERARLVARIEAGWPDVASFGALEQARYRLRLLELLGAAAEVAAHRDEVHALLRAHWIGTRRTVFASTGGFSPDAVRFPTSLPDATEAAIELMARHGAPPEVDLRLVRGYLRAESAAFPAVFEWLPELRAPARASLLRLEREFGLPPRGVLARLAGERALIAALLVVVLCLVAVRRTAVSEPPPPGALP